MEITGKQNKYAEVKLMHGDVLCSYVRTWLGVQNCALLDLNY